MGARIEKFVKNVTGIDLYTTPTTPPTPEQAAASGYKERISTNPTTGEVTHWNTTRWETDEEGVERRVAETNNGGWTRKT
ncbi:hypothetical protein KA012_03110 [Candidatus Woesebacteria bacterium]|nr:hypothetical protein [Candidatus Woesebacteria bacterium]